jgi:hypothetical protein
VGICRIRAQMLPDDFSRLLSGVSDFLKYERRTPACHV